MRLALWPSHEYNIDIGVMNVPARSATLCYCCLLTTKEEGNSLPKVEEGCVDLVFHYLLLQNIMNYMYIFLYMYYIIIMLQMQELNSRRRCIG
mgnify:CR=1 FL=1